MQASILFYAGPLPVLGTGNSRTIISYHGITQSNHEWLRDKSDQLSDLVSGAGQVAVASGSADVRFHSERQTMLRLLIYCVILGVVARADPFTFAPFTFPTPPSPPPLFLGNDINVSMATVAPPVNITIDPEAIMNVPEIIRHWGYPVEVHTVTTGDGYILQLHRIPYGKKPSKFKKGERPVVFLQHGLLCTSSIWLLNLPHQSAGFVLADAGFDVWFGNMRGNVYSKEHVRLPNTDPRFWRFSWEQMARHDLPTMIDYVLNTTERTSLYYVGHSQGTLTMFAHLSENPEFSKKITKFFALAPVGRMAHVEGLFKYLGQIYEQFNLVYTIFGDNEFLTNNLFTSLLTNIICDKQLNNDLCENFIFSVSGPNSNQFNTSRIGIYLAHNPAGTSVRNMVHFAQMVRGRKMSMFDHGTEDNMKIYRQTTPPEYDLTNIEAPLYLFYSPYDWLANPTDVEQFLLRALPKEHLKMVKKLKDFNHNDFLWGLRARKEIYDPIINIIRLDYRLSAARAQTKVSRGISRTNLNDTIALD